MEELKQAFTEIEEVQTSPSAATEETNADPAERSADENARAIAAIDQQLAALAERERKLKAERATVETVLLDQYVQGGIQSVRVLDRTVYLYRSAFAELLPGVEAPELIAALDSVGLGEQLAGRKINKAGLDALAREWRDEQQGTLEEVRVPEGLDLVLKVGEAFKIRSRKA